MVSHGTHVVAILNDRLEQAHSRNYHHPRFECTRRSTTLGNEVRLQLPQAYPNERMVRPPWFDPFRSRSTNISPARRRLNQASRASLLGDESAGRVFVRFAMPWTGLPRTPLCLFPVSPREAEPLADRSARWTSYGAVESTKKINLHLAPPLNSPPLPHDNCRSSHRSF